MIEESTNTKPTDTDDFEINFADILTFVKTHYRMVALSGVLGAIVAALYSLTLPNQYQVTTLLLPESGASSSGGGLGALAGLAGLSMPTGGGATDVVRPDLYPNILQSTPFALELAQKKVYDSKTKRLLTIEEYFDEQQRSWFSEWFGKDTPKSVTILDPKQTSKALELTGKQTGLVANIQKSVSAANDRKTGIVTISTEMTDPVVAAATANHALEYLKAYVIGYRTDKARHQLKFLGERVAEAKQRYQAAEYALAGFKDRNSYLVAKTAIVSEQRLTAEFMLAQNVYSGLVQQYEQAKVKIQEETPVFKILQPAQIPLSRSSPKRSMITVIGGVIGAVLCLGFILARQFLKI